MGRLEEKLLEASGAAKRITDTIEARADALIAREASLDRRTDEVFMPHENILQDAEKGLDAAEAALRLLNNDPLPSSGTSPESHPNGSGASTEPQSTGTL